ncbi:cAMP-binding domain of CRP or a regulatory subunit of cAMP-dependent protein kinases [Roseivivax halotolerans]|uniref:cAMP-binding domain of CRP or a regulatory subunit of cAMP-dependent protein kinases n=1 Tax=Roseivivax halotolerans TaxID=93684 RepID=A0A1I5UNL5_9RHOB|nr:Crp/Fnr family transcriptional regulator [Roseivivax halotolerans]SFP96819.1 cAMP-binding domain of CRP or a regulatory subunit of cAMP-dependent protein kinases [Roseivivax halotolerans]
MATRCANCPIRKLPLFKPMSEREVAFMERFKIGEMSVQSGTPLLSEGSTSPQLFTALSGFGLRYKLLPNGKKQVLSFVLPGDLIGLQAGVMGQMTHSVEATTHMTLCVFNRSELWTLFRNHAERAFDVTWIAASEERFLGEALATIGQKSATESVAWAFARLYRRLEAINMRNGITVPMPYTQQNLADALGLSLVHTNKTLARLREQQLATWSEGRLSIPDIEALEEIGLVEEKPSLRPLL